VRLSITNRCSDRSFPGNRRGVTILYFADTRFPIERANGVQTMATCHALAARGHRVKLIARPDPSSPPRDPFAFYDLPPLPELQIETIAGGANVRARRAHFLLSAARRALTVRPDIVYTRDLGVAAFLLKLPSARRPPVVYESHGVSFVVSQEMPQLLGNPALAPSRQKVQRLHRRERRVWRLADAYVTITHALADELTAHFGDRPRLFVVPDGARVAPAAREPVRVEKPSTPTAVYAGHLYPWKGVDLFVRALQLAPSMSGLIIGGHAQEPDFDRVAALVRELGISDRVLMIGAVPPGEVARRLSAATMLVLPNVRSAISERYTSPLKLFEYLAAGRPIVASDLPAIREVLTADDTAVLVPPDDPQAWANAMTLVAADAALAERLARAAAELAPRYSWDRRAERLEAVLTNTIVR
jgi:glycosyltransferase involved in cell wall biosynthesis